jgi:hypothetical protein
MSTLTLLGKVVRSDLEGGAWTLVTDQGVVYQLQGGGSDLYVDGARVEVKGRIATKAMGIAMLGEILEVKGYRHLH